MNRRFVFSHPSSASARHLIVPAISQSGMPENIIVTKLDAFIATVQLNRPKVLNALNLELMIELVEALEELDRDPDVRCIVLHGSERAFAAGADITEMAEATPTDMLTRDQFTRWDRIRRVKTPIIAAV